MKKIKLDKIREFANVLRSGKYKKATGTLKDYRDGSVCALGAAKEHFEMPGNYDEANIAEEFGLSDFFTLDFRDYKGRNKKVLKHKERLEYASERNPNINPNEINIPSINDCGATFRQIADMIDAMADRYENGECRPK